MQFIHKEITLNQCQEKTNEIQSILYVLTTLKKEVIVLTVGPIHMFICVHRFITPSIIFVERF